MFDTKSGFSTTGITNGDFDNKNGYLNDLGTN
jgi:hypothetical protein